METKIGGGLSGATMGPYRATKLWNDVILTFRTGLPLGRHRRYMRTYENCFVASDAVDWLHDHLKNNPNFGATVSRSQTVQLMEKFHKSRVFEDVRGGKHNRGELADNRRLFMFTHNSPIKTSRAPLGSKTNLMSQRDPTQPLKLDHEKLTPITCIPPTGLPECRLVARPLTPQEITETWKDHTLESLREAVGLASLSELVDSSLVNGQQIMHNCLYINKNGVVTNIESKDQLPHWTLSAMRCLAHWPNKTDSILPRYPGFERDVFRVITEYFQGLKEPLLTYDMYEVITNVYVFTENRFVKHSSPNTTGFFDTPPSIASFASVENLIMNLTMNTGGPCFRRTDRQSRLHRSASTHDCHTSSTSLHLSNAHPQAESSNIYGTKRYGSMTSLPVQPVTKFETAFGPDNRTVTRVFYTSSSSGSFDSGNGMSSLSRDFFSNGCVEADQNHQITWHNSSEHVEQTTESSESQSQTHRRRRIVSGPNGPVPLRRPHSVICAGPYSAEDNLSGSHFEYCTLPRLPKDQSRRAQRSESFNQAVVRKQNDNAPHQRGDERLHSEKINGNSSNTKYSSLSSGIDNPSFNFDQSSRPSTNKPPPYKPPPGYHRDHQHRYSNSHDKPPHPPRIHIQVEGGGDNNPAALFGPGYRRTARTRHRSNSFTNLTASPITAAPEMGTPSFMKRCGSMPDLSASGVKEKLRDCLQLCLLLLPPANRRKLHLLLRMMSKMLENKELVLDEEQPMRSLLLEKFSRSVLRSPEEADMDELLGVQIVGFLVDNYMEIMSVPVKLKTKVEDDLTQMKHSSTKIVYSLEDPSMITYCKQVSMAEFDKQQQTFSQDALSDLLDAIINDNTMGNKEKRKRMKEFQKTYPLIYDKRFPTKESEAEIFPTSTQEKPALLRRPLQKLRNMRL